MSLLTQEESQQLQSYYNGDTLVEDVQKTTADGDESIQKITLNTGRIANFVYHHATDSITVFNVEDAPPPTEILKINSLIENSDQFRSLLNN
jgi:hypothetical protein